MYKNVQNFTNCRQFCTTSHTTIQNLYTKVHTTQFLQHFNKMNFESLQKTFSKKSTKHKKNTILCTKLYKDFWFLKSLQQKIQKLHKIYNIATNFTTLLQQKTYTQLSQTQFFFAPKLFNTQNFKHLTIYLNETLHNSTSQPHASEPISGVYT